MSVDDRFDFHLVAQKVTQGTSTPTHYIVAYDSSRIPQEDLVRFTYEQCYNYYNWQGSVKVPSCLQYANKLSKLAGESIQKPFVDSKLSDSLYFLWRTQWSYDACICQNPSSFTSLINAR